MDDEISGLFQKVTVKPGVSLDHLETVLVVEKGLAIEKVSKLAQADSKSTELDSSQLAKTKLLQNGAEGPR